ncbi:MAG TPA: hypothetical protein PLU17_04570 [Chitinophagaceae bacterium]|nr:hypothetical protein [Chitinophagaceae bacterium]
MLRIYNLSITILGSLFLLLISFQSNAHSESLSYSVMKDNKPIGRIHIDRIKTNDMTEYFFESNVKLTFLISIEVYDRMKVIFKGSHMLQAQLYRTLNGKVKVDNYSTWNGKFYNMTNKDNEKKTIKQAINLTTANLYYVEPLNIPYVFSEKFQQMIPIKKAGLRRYMLDLPNGNKTYYSYTNGICSLVEAETDWASLKFVLNRS